MNEETKKKFKPEQRLEVIKRELPRGSTQSEIAELCGVCRETINRDIRAWELSDGFGEWARREFRELYYDLKDEDKPLTFRELGKLVARSMTQRTESKVEGFGKLIIWRPGEEKESDI